MKDTNMTKKQLLSELEEMRRRIGELEALQAERKKVEEKLREQAQIMEHVHDIVICTDLDGHVLNWNKGAEKVYGYSAEEVLGKHMSFMYKDKQRQDSFLQQVIKPLLEKESHDVEVEVPTKTGEQKYIHLSFSVIRDNNGNAIMMCGYGIDITVRKRAEEALIESEEKYRTLVEDALIGIINVDITGKITYVNNTIIHDTGYSREDLIGKNAFRLGLVSSEMKKVLRKRMKEKLTGQPPGLLQLQFKCKDGKLIWLQIRGKVIWKHNIPVGIQIIGEDITERKQAEEALRESEENYRNIVELAPDGIMTVDTRGVVTSCNTSLLQLTGFTKAEIVGKHFSKLPPANVKDIPTYFKLFASLSKGQKAKSTEMPWKHKDGTQRSCEFRTSLIKREGKTTGIQAIIRDITERKRAEEALRESEEKFARAFRSSPDRITITTIKDGRFVDVNDSYLRFTGYTREEVIGHPVSDLGSWVKPEEREKIVRILKKGGRVSNEEVHLRIKSGEIRTSLFSSELIEIVGEPCMISVATDITERKRVEEALRESEERFRSVAESAGNAIISVDSYGNIILWNKAAETIFKYSAEEVVGHPLTIIMPERFIEDYKKGINFAVSNGALRFSAKRHYLMGLRKDGSEFPLEISLAAWKMRGEIFFTGILTDITERKQAEEALRESRDFLQELTNSMEDIVLSVKMPDRIIEWVNTSVRILGYEPAECIGRTTEFIYQDRSEFLDFGKKLEEAITSEKAVLHTEQSLKRKNGEVFPAEITATIHREEGKAVRATSIVRDITERKQAEEALKESEERFRIASQTTSDVVYERDFQTGIATFYGDIDSHLGYEPGGYPRTMEGWREHVHPEDLAKIESQDIDRLEPGIPYSIEYRMRKKDGTYITWSDSIIVIRDEETGQPIKFIGAATDITERKEAEEKAREAETLRQLDRLRGQLLANISHELRTPLASIKGFATMLLDYDRRLKRDEKRAHLKTIDENADRLAELIEQLLQMSRLDAGLVSIDRVPTSISNLCRGSIIEARVRAPDHDIVLDLPKRLPKVYIDVRRIQQVLDNCIDNATKYSPPGTEVTVTARRVGQEILFTVTDRGAGIMKEDLPRVFDRMFRSQKEHIEGVVGVGLGLSICKGLVEAHGGRIWLESEEGRGTRCFFTLPVYTRQGDSHGKKAKT